MAMEAADKAGCSLIFANDPDADRLAVAEKIRPLDRPTEDAAAESMGSAGACEEEEGDSWRIFTGNETGLLLGEWMYSATASQASEEGNPRDPVDPVDPVDRKVAMLASTVSSGMLGLVAKHEGFLFEGGRSIDYIRLRSIDLMR